MSSSILLRRLRLVRVGRRSPPTSMASRSISIPATTPSCTVRALSSSSSDDKSRMARDNAAVLRAMRKGEDVTSHHASTEDRVDYRYRAGDRDSNVSNDGVIVHGARIKSPLDLWGPSAVKAEQRQQNRIQQER